MAHFIFSAFCDESGETTIGGQMAACKANGITHMELRGFGDKSINTMSVDEAKEMKKEIDEQGMFVASIGSFYGKIEITDDFEPHFEQFKNTIEVAKILQAKYIRIFSFFFTKGESHAEYREEVIRRVRIMADYANENGIIPCLENEKEVYGDTAERMNDLLREIDNLVGVFDPSNFVQCGVDTLKAWDLIGDKIEYFHIKDALFKDGSVVPSGEGDGNVVAILKQFAQKDGERVLSLEPHLKVFDGFSNLETDDTAQKQMQENVYSSHKESFKAAADAMHKVAREAQPIRLGIIGTGNMGRSHAGNFLKGKICDMRVTAVADIVDEKMDWIRERMPQVKCFDSAEALMDSGEVDAVIICTPHYFHPPYVIMALQKNLHVISEKPAGVYTKQVRQMNEEASKSDKVFAMMFNQRTNCIYRKIKEIVDSGEYGEIRRVNWIITDWYRTQAYYNSGGWRATWAGEGGGVLLNQCPHQLDLWQWICGMPSKIRAFCHYGKWHDIEVEDDVTIYAEYPNGATGMFITTTGDYPGTNRLEITLDKAKIVCDNSRGKDTLEISVLEESVTENCANCKDGFTDIKFETLPIETDGKNEQHIGILNAFSSHILNGTPLVAKGEEGINGLMISNAAHLSSWLDDTVTLPIDEDVFYSELQKRVATSKIKTNVVETVAQDMDKSFSK